MADYQNSLNVANFALLSGLLNSTNMIKYYNASFFLRGRNVVNQSVLARNSQGRAAWLLHWKHTFLIASAYVECGSMFVSEKG